MSNNLSDVTNTLSQREKNSAIIWLVIGILQCLSVVLFVAGVWNIVASVSRFKSAKLVLNPWCGIVNSYDKWLTNIIISIVINVIFGGVIGIAGALYDLFAVRNYVLDNRTVFEEAGL